ncbi:uncharacterized protein LOC126740581 [Anthonomus grandis grandis]|uniref:uncharacterized protein LOC126740581 n=1 Tax=Anthonomus grandis grandis TaxID=2921223 RepID=UPI002166B967|nr:uncharacterized protein LOC126740581 [Anthonomus grandis grandis]
MSFTMVSPLLGLVSLKSLMDRKADSPADDTILSRIKRLVTTHLPTSCLNWRVHVLSKEEILGEEPDPQILNKIRFALPTVELARAFAPDCTSLSERAYRDIKMKMLNWPLCVGLIIGPSSLVIRIRGTSTSIDLMMASIAEIKPVLLSREEASRELAGNLTEKFSISSQTSSGTKRSSRLDRLEESHLELKGMLESFMKRFDRPDTSESKYSSGDEQTFNVEDINTNMSSPEPSEVPWAPPECPMDEEFDFCPVAREQEPAVPAPKSHIADQGISCQRLGELSFKQIRYADVQKKLQAAPVFSALKINPAFSKHSNSNTQSQESLTKSDSMLGTILHGLLLQREALSNSVKELSAKHPALKQNLSQVFGAASSFKSISDDILQYVCGRRAEVIE